MKMQPKVIASALAALLASLGTAYAAENSGGGKMNNVLKESNPLSRMAAPGGPHKCPDGTYCQEPAGTNEQAITIKAPSSEANWSKYCKNHPDDSRCKESTK